ncbi:MAG: family 16 glycosylhydrolase, partial [Granulosicoccus sp.]|nr:family 16 glycosylhydrolase [Granulosicoccus sp.]
PEPEPEPEPAPEPPAPTEDPFNGHLELEEAVAPADGLPSVPQHLRVDLLGNDWVELNWTPSADNGEVVEYRLYRDDGVTYRIRGDQTDPSSGSQNEINKYWSTTSFIDCNFTRFADRVHKCGENSPEIGSSHWYQISAVDDDGNESALSDPLFVQLYSESGAPVAPYTDIYLDGDDTFPFETDFSSTDNFLSRFELVFADEFNGSELDTSKWNTSLTWGHTEAINGEQQYFVDTINFPDFGYDPFKFTGSALSIEAIQTPSSLNSAALGQAFLSGALSSHDKFGFTYGYTEGRMKVGGVSGQLSSFYLFRRWAAEHSPEIDIVEYLGENPFGDEDAFQTYHFTDTVHGNTRSSPTMIAKKDSGNFSDEYHTFGVLWEPSLVIWYIDGQEVKRLSGPQIGRQSMNIVTYLVTGSEWAPTPDTTADNFPLTFEIDYIRVYQRDPYIR